MRPKQEQGLLDGISEIEGIARRKALPCPKAVSRPKTLVAVLRWLHRKRNRIVLGSLDDPKRHPAFWAHATHPFLKDPRNELWTNLD